MSDDIRLSGSNLPGFRADASCGGLTPRRSGGSRRTDIAAARALEPVIQSALGIVRESAGLLYHIAGFGIALVSGPENSQPKYGAGRTRQIAPQGANVIPFSSARFRATANIQTAMDHDHHE
jgi:hypothetical protein